MEKYLKRAATIEKENETPKRKREASIVWDHFKKTSDKHLGICNYCGKHLKTAGNTTNLSDYLKRCHPDRLKGEKAQNMPKVMETFLHSEPSYSNESVKKKKIDQKVMRMIALDVQPFSIVEDEGFIDLLKEMDSRYRLPSRTFFRDVVLPKEYDAAKARLVSVLDNIEYVALTTDMWTSKSNEGYITVTCHFVCETFEPKSAVLSTEQLLNPTNHTAANVAESLRSVIHDWGLTKKVVAVVTDNDSTMRKACDLLELKHLPCVAHTINLIVQDILKLEILEPVMVKAKSVVTFFKKSSVAYAKFKMAQGVDDPFGLIQETPTRWNSAFDMIKRLIKIKDHTSAILINSRNAPSPITADEFDSLNELCDLLEPFAEATVLVSTDKAVSISIIIPTICELYHKINSIQPQLVTNIGIAVCDAFKTRLSARLSTYETRTIPRIATLLDPRFKKDGFLLPSNADQAVKALEEELIHIMQMTPRQQPTPPKEETNNKFSFLRTKVKIQSSRADAIITMSTEEMALQAVAKKYLCVPGTSCESERMFSKAGQLVSERRTRLRSTTVDKLLFLNKNMKKF